MKKYLALIGLSLMACEPKPPQGWAEATATQWAKNAALDHIAIVCHRDSYYTTSFCSINTGNQQLVNLWCYYEDTPYCLPAIK